MPKLTLTIEKATVLLRNGTDIVYLKTNKPSPFPPSVSRDSLSLSFEVVADGGEAYCKQHFGLEPETINARGEGWH